MSKDVLTFLISLRDDKTFAISYNQRTFVFNLASSIFSFEILIAASSRENFFFQLKNKHIKLSQRVPNDLTLQS